MKKLLYLFLVLVVVLTVWLSLTKQKPSAPLAPAQTNAIVESPSPQPETNLTEASSNTVPVQPTNTIESIVSLTNALTTTNLEQWKAAIKDLKPLAGFKLKQDWMMEKTNRLDGIPIVFQLNGNTVSFSARLIDITAKNGTGDIIEVEMHSPIMNIDETRELGLQLCNMLGQDPSGFLAWCDKVGNHWLDAPLYGVGESSRHYSFQIYRTYTDEKPWYINFMIISNP